jgi:hypothetical protein
MSINTSRLGLAVAGVAVAVLGMTVPANASANDGCGAYCPSNVGSPSGNGNGHAADHAPGAGTKGKADSKFPPGQAPDGNDNNNGYECDGNSGVGKSNPAHTGCDGVASVTSEVVS